MIARTHEPALRLPQPPPPGVARQHLEHGGITWIDIVRPDVEQISGLREHYNFHPLHLEDVLSRLQRPKIDDNPESGYVFLVLHFPVFDKSRRVSTASEVDVFAGRDFVITMHDGRLKPMLRLVSGALDQDKREQLMGRGSGYLLYRILDVLISSCFPMVYRVDQHLDRIESEIFERDVQTTVQDLSFVRRDIIALRRIIRPNIPVVRSLEVRERTFLRVDEEVYFGDLTDSLAKLWDMLEEQNEIIIGLNATIDSLTSHRINQVMKIFTAISVIMLPMTLVASIMGMNVDLPYAGSPLALPFTIIVMLVLAGGMFAYFRYKNWL